MMAACILSFLSFLVAPPDPPPFLSGPSQMARLAPFGEGRLWVRGRPLESSPPSATLWALSLAEEEMFRDLGPRMPAQGPLRQPPVPAQLPWLAGMKYPDIPVVFDETVIRYLQYFRFDPGGRATIKSWIEASGRWRTLILDALARRGLPAAMLYVAMIESGFSVKTRSSAGALGLWQFMPDGARTYGLRITHFIDQRMDPELSTEAVMFYFEDLKLRFRDWHLALAAYNCGYGRMMQSMRRYQTNDFWKLQKYENALPRETQLYVPKWIAVAIVDLNRDLFLLPKLRMEAPYAFEEALAPGGMTLAKVAQLAGVNADDVVKLNPEYLRGRLPPEAKTARVRLPYGSRSAFEAALRKLSPEWADFAVHAVRFGETVEMVAAMYRTSAARIRAMNQLAASADLAPGMVIVVPKVERLEEPVRPPRKTPFVAIPSDVAVPDGRVRMFYRTCAQDTVELVAQGLQVSVEDLVAWNHLNPDAALVSDMVLQVFVEPSAARHAALFSPDTVKVVVVDSEEFIAHYLEAYDRVRILHTVTAGQTLEKIAERYGTTVSSIRTINKGHAFAPGSVIAVYAKKDRVPRNLPVPEEKPEPKADGDLDAPAPVSGETSSSGNPPPDSGEKPSGGNPSGGNPPPGAGEKPSGGNPPPGAGEKPSGGNPPPGAGEKPSGEKPSDENLPPAAEPEGKPEAALRPDATLRIVADALRLLVNLAPRTQLAPEWKRDQASSRGRIWLGAVPPKGTSP